GGPAPKLEGPAELDCAQLTIQRTVTWPSVIGKSGSAGLAVQGVAFPMNEKLIASGGSLADLPLSCTSVMTGRPDRSAPLKLPCLMMPLTQAWLPWTNTQFTSTWMPPWSWPN